MIDSLKDRIFNIFRNHSLPRWLVLLVDLAAVYFSFLIAYMLRYNFELYTFQISTAFRQAGLVLLVYLVFMLLFKSYSGMIRHTTIRDTFLIVITNSVALLALFAITLLSRKNQWIPLFNVPLSIILIHSVSVTLFLFLFRVFIKMFYIFASSSFGDRKNVLIYGSDDQGLMAKRVIQSDPNGYLKLKGFIDDDKRIQGKALDGFPVYSKTILTTEFVISEDIKAIIFAKKEVSGPGFNEVLQLAMKLGLEILEAPSFDQLLNGKQPVKKLKKVQFEDLLGRKPISLDLQKIDEGLRDKTILITGAAGSIGSEIVRQLTKFHYKNLILVDQAETPSFYLDDELKSKFSGCRYELIIGDVTNKIKMDLIFRKYLPEVVFHAAAYKHVPMMEANPHEAFRVNVGGTLIISELAVKYNAQKFVMISSDKAVNPTNVMGATKKICEMIVHGMSLKYSSGTKFVTTRFGNVLGSNGSVIPLFKKQIAEGGPVTITDPDITRFFMTIPEACQLVLEAGFMGNGGHIYVFDMGEPIKILDIATNLILLSGLQPYKDIKIKFTGLRPGEKLYEELFNTDEPRISTHNPKITIAQVSDTDCESILVKIETILETLYNISKEDLISEILEIVPGYTSKLTAKQLP